MKRKDISIFGDIFSIKDKNDTIDNIRKEIPSDKNFETKIEEIPIEKLRPFFVADHPFKSYDDTAKEELKESIALNGLINPIIVRTLDKLEYEIISGHNRVIACKELDHDSIACIVLNLTDEEAVLMMTGANLNQRQSLLPSEKAKAYRLIVDVRKELKEENSLIKIANDESINREEIRRYYRLSHLNDNLLNRVDNKQVAIVAGVELSYLSVDKQEKLNEFLTTNKVKVNLKQSKMLRKQSENNAINFSLILAKKNNKKKKDIKIDYSEVRKFFTDDMSVDEIRESVLTILAKHFED